MNYERMVGEFGASTHAVLEDTEQLHDGRWLWIRVLDLGDAEDVKRLLRAKRKLQE